MRRWRNNTDPTTALAIDLLNPRKRERLSVGSDSLTPDMPIPDAFSEYGRRQSPALHWAGVPDGTQSIVVLLEDPDAPGPKPFSHWVLFNLPPDVTELPASIPADVRLPDFGNASQGQSSAGPVGYFGPRPPEGDGPHRYHFEVFALDCVLDLAAGAGRDAVVDAMKGHVLASGELVGTYAAPASVSSK